MDEKREKEINRLFIEFAQQMKERFPNIEPCPSVGIGFMLNNKDCIACGNEYPKYKEDCRKKTKLMTDLRDRGKGF